MYQLNKDKETGKFQVIENETSRTIFESDTHAVAHKVYRKFSGGQGFTGWTPDFMFYGDFKFTPEQEVA